MRVKKFSEKNKYVIIDTSERHYSIENIINVQLEYVKKNRKYDSKYFYIHCTLNLSSPVQFYSPVSDNPVDWGSRIRNKDLATLKSEANLLEYIRLLQQGNNARLLWGSNEEIKTLKSKFEKTFPKIPSEWVSDYKRIQ